MTDRILFHNATLYAHDRVVERGWLLVEGSRIQSLRADEPPPMEAERIDVGGRALAPGLIDIHAHGALGHDTMDATPEALQAIARFKARHGVTAFLATTMTSPLEAILAALENVAHVMAEGTGGATLLGAHVEGPYIDVERRGCQDASLVRCATPQEYEPIVTTGVVRLITLAPEYPENRELIRYAYERDIAIAAGHTRSSYEQMQEAVELGLGQVTHLFNGMEPMHHRKPGAVGAALTLDALRCQLIADTIHIHPAVLKLAVRAKGPGRIILVTDAMSGAGMPDGEYMLGGLAVTVHDGVARIRSGPEAVGALAGSTLTLERGVANIMAAADLSLEEALPMASRVPAEALGIDARKGSIVPGKDADLIILDDDMTVQLTMIEGQIVHS